MNTTHLPTVSVVICAYNEEKLILSCLKGLQQQCYPSEKYELIIIDDESTDNTFELVSTFISKTQSHCPRTALHRIKHGGLSVARNTGISLSQGELIAFIDGDAIPEMNWLSELIKPLTSGADYVGGRIDLLNVESKVAQVLQLTRHRQFFGPTLFQDQFIGCNMAFRREVFDAAGGFHENFISRGDETTLREIIAHKFKYAPAMDSVVLHERPSRLRNYFKVAWQSSKLSYLSHKASGKKMDYRFWISMLEALLLAGFPITLIGFILEPTILFLPFILSSIAFLRKLFFRKINKAICNGLITEYGKILAPLIYVAYVYQKDVIDAFGKIIGILLYRKERIIQPNTTPISIIACVKSYKND